MKPAKYLLCALVAIHTQAALAQKSWTTSAGTANITVLETDPDKYKRTVLYMDLLSIETYNDVSGYCTFKLETVIGDRIMPYISTRYTWMDAATRRVSNDYPTSEGGLDKMGVTDIGAAFFFKSKTRDRQVKIVLKSSSGGGYTYSKYTYVPSQVKRMTGIRGGLFNFRKALRFEDDSHPNYRYKSTDGLTDLPINSVGVFTDPQPAGLSYMPMSMSSVNCLYAGLQLRKITNTVVRVAGYGKRRNAKLVDFYMDVMYAPSIRIANVVDIDDKEWVLEPQANALRRLGFRTGYAMHSSKNAGITFSNEFGLRPGPKMSKSFTSSGAYISLGFGMSIASGKYIKLGSKGKDKK